ncbi:MAG: hypothetical protein ACLFTT_18700 [Candidatus Hydrogenedentota bacterium]
MSRRVRNAILLAVVATLIGLAIAVQTRVDDARAEPGDALLYLPNEKLLHHFTAGMDSVIADLIWLKCIQYTAIELKGEHGFRWLQHMLETAVRLDPYFTDVYRYGGMLLAALRADDEAALDLLKRGAVMRPEAWELPYEMGMVYLLNRRDEPDAHKMAGYYFAMSAAASPDAPGHVREVADRLGGEYSLTEIERTMWTKMLESDDRLLRKLAQEKLIMLELRQFAEHATGIARAFERRTGRHPDSLEELRKAGYLQTVPEDPLGGRFLIGEDGSVYSTTILDAELERRRNLLEKHIAKFRDSQGHWPDSLAALLDVTGLRIVPAHPYPGRSWAYDPATGALGEAP